MNSACIIAACAANARRHNEQSTPKEYLTKKLEVYYKVRFRMYLHFNSITTIIPSAEEVFVGSIFAPVKVHELKTITIPASTIAREHIFSVAASKCPNGPDRYVEDNLERFKNSLVWSFYKHELTDKYKADVKDKFGVTLEDSAVDCTIQYCWEIDCE